MMNNFNTQLSLGLAIKSKAFKWWASILFNLQNLTQALRPNGAEFDWHISGKTFEPNL